MIDKKADGNKDRVIEQNLLESEIDQFLSQFTELEFAKEICKAEFIFDTAAIHRFMFAKNNADRIQFACIIRFVGTFMAVRSRRSRAGTGCCGRSW